jgi:hypothetical protein
VIVVVSVSLSVCCLWSLHALYLCSCLYVCVTTVAISPLSPLAPLSPLSPLSRLSPLSPLTVAILLLYQYEFPWCLSVYMCVKETRGTVESQGWAGFVMRQMNQIGKNRLFVKPTGIVEIISIQLQSNLTVLKYWITFWDNYKKSVSNDEIKSNFPKSSKLFTKKSIFFFIFFSSNTVHPFTKKVGDIGIRKKYSVRHRLKVTWAYQGDWWNEMDQRE